MQLVVQLALQLTLYQEVGSKSVDSLNGMVQPSQFSAVHLYAPVLSSTAAQSNKLHLH